MKKIMILFLFVYGILKADNVTFQNHGFIQNNGTINNIQNNYDIEKADADIKIHKLANELIDGQQNPENESKQAVLVGAKKANELNLSLDNKKEKCIEYALSIKLFKVDVKFVRNECDFIFSK